MAFMPASKNVIHVNGTSAAGIAGTSEQTLMTYSLPAGMLKRNGQSLRIKAWGLTGTNSNDKTFKLYFGATSISTGTQTGSAKVCELNMEVLRLGDASATILSGGVADSTNLARANAANTDDLTAAVVIKLTGTGGTSGVDCIAKGLIVEMGLEA